MKKLSSGKNLTGGTTHPRESPRTAKEKDGTKIKI